MTAKVTSTLTNVYAKYIDGETGVFELNDHFAQIQGAINIIVQKIIKRGYNMSDMELKQITDIGESIEVFNDNVATINSYLVSISELIGTDYLISKEILSTLRIDLLNTNTSAGVRVNPDNFSMTLANGQEISVVEGEVVSVLGDETLTLTHA